MRAFGQPDADLSRSNNREPLGTLPSPPHVAESQRNDNSTLEQLLRILRNPDGCEISDGAEVGFESGDPSSPRVGRPLRRPSRKPGTVFPTLPQRATPNSQGDAGESPRDHGAVVREDSPSSPLVSTQRDLESVSQEKQQILLTPRTSSRTAPKQLQEQASRPRTASGGPDNNGIGHSDPKLAATRVSSITAGEHEVRTACLPRCAVPTPNSRGLMADVQACLDPTAGMYTAGLHVVRGAANGSEDKAAGTAVKIDLGKTALEIAEELRDTVHSVARGREARATDEDVNEDLQGQRDVDEARRREGPVNGRGKTPTRVAVARRELQQKLQEQQQQERARQLRARQERKKLAPQVRARSRSRRRPHAIASQSEADPRPLAGCCDIKKCLERQSGQERASSAWKINIRQEVDGNAKAVMDGQGKTVAPSVSLTEACMVEEEAAEGAAGQVTTESFARQEEDGHGTAGVRVNVTDAVIYGGSPLRQLEEGNGESPRTHSEGRGTAGFALDGKGLRTPGSSPPKPGNLTESLAQGPRESLSPVAATDRLESPLTGKHVDDDIDRRSDDQSLASEMMASTFEARVDLLKNEARTGAGGRERNPCDRGESLRASDYGQQLESESSVDAVIGRIEPVGGEQPRLSVPSLDVDTQGVREGCGDSSTESGSIDLCADGYESLEGIIYSATEDGSGTDNYEDDDNDDDDPQAAYKNSTSPWIEYFRKCADQAALAAQLLAYVRTAEDWRIWHTHAVAYHRLMAGSGREAEWMTRDRLIEASARLMADHRGYEILFQRRQAAPRTLLFDEAHVGYLVVEGVRARAAVETNAVVSERICQGQLELDRLLLQEYGVVVWSNNDSGSDSDESDGAVYVAPEPPQALRPGEAMHGLPFLSAATPQLPASLVQSTKRDNAMGYYGGEHYRDNDSGNEHLTENADTAHLSIPAPPHSKPLIWVCAEGLRKIMRKCGDAEAAGSAAAQGSDMDGEEDTKTAGGGEEACGAEDVAEFPRTTRLRGLSDPFGVVESTRDGAMPVRRFLQCLL